jgi:hypothetical protein
MKLRGRRSPADRRASASVQTTSKEREPMNNDLDTARGLVYGVAWSLVIWALVAVGIALMLNVS